MKTYVYNRNGYDIILGVSLHLIECLLSVPNTRRENPEKLLVSEVTFCEQIKLEKIYSVHAMVLPCNSRHSHRLQEDFARIEFWEIFLPVDAIKNLFFEYHRGIWLKTQQHCLAVTCKKINESCRGYKAKQSSSEDNADNSILQKETNHTSFKESRTQTNIE